MTTEAKARTFARLTALLGVCVLLVDAVADYPWFW